MQIRFINTYEFWCYDKNGNLKWHEKTPNTVVNEGLDDVLDNYLKGSSYTAAFYVGLKGSGSISASDTMSSHAGWSEVTAYSESVRQALTLGSVSGQSVDNSSSNAQFSINASATIAGGFIATDDTKGGSSGTLFGAADFTSPRSMSDGDTLNVEITITAASA